MAKITINREFRDRTDLDEFVRSRLGSDAQKNSDHVIEASAEELTKLGLSESTTVFGVRVVTSKKKEKNT